MRAIGLQKFFLIFILLLTARLLGSLIQCLLRILISMINTNLARGKVGFESNALLIQSFHRLLCFSFSLSFEARVFQRRFLLNGL